ncbi:MAG: glycosyltransferase family 4 protein [Candidatus Aenigmarchaeota archaeon]|nr:glycosyltransferase family 4 protein [Candidatus Aenigmarchaeota archaeon]
MRFLVSVENFNPPLGGGEVFFQELAMALAKKDEVSVAYAGEKKELGNIRMYDTPRSAVFKDVPLFNRSITREFFAHFAWKSYLKSVMPHIDPDVVITQLEFTPSSVEIAKEYGKKSVVYISNYDHFCPFSFRNRSPSCNRACFRCAPLSYKLQYLFFKKYIAWQEKALRDADIILANSSFTAQVLKGFYGLDAEVFYPVIFLEDFIAIKGNFITFINPIPIKGSDIFIKIAEAMPEERFLVVGSNCPDKIKNLPNITHIPRAAAMREVYSKTRMLLVPSAWHEPFGRVVLEAGISGIPCIASNMGGLPDAVGNGGMLVDDIYNVGEWVRAIEHMNDKTTYKKFSRNAKDHAMQFTSKKQMKRFYGFTARL